MKLVLANNQTKTFQDFYGGISNEINGGIEYGAYNQLLFYFNVDGIPLKVTFSGRDITEYDGVYINGYLRTYELAASAAMACNILGVKFVNHEMSVAPSLSKLTMHVKLAGKSLPVPSTIAGTKKAILEGVIGRDNIAFPMILKRADADRGIDNFKVKNYEEVQAMLVSHEDDSLWLLQQFIDNDGFYLVSYYGGEAKFCIFRSLEERPDNNELKAHMFKPAGGANASNIPLEQVPAEILEATSMAVTCMDRQIGSVDCLYDKSARKVYILEVNYNPQLVTIETFKDVRKQAFIDYMGKSWD